ADAAGDDDGDAVAFFEGEDAVADQEPGGEGGEDLFGGRVFFQVDIGDVEAGGEEAQERFLAHPVRRENRVFERLAFGEEGSDALGGDRADQPSLDHLGYDVFHRRCLRKNDGRICFSFTNLANE